MSRIRDEPTVRPAIPFFQAGTRAGVAQLVEQLICNQ